MPKEAELKLVIKLEIKAATRIIMISLAKGYGNLFFLFFSQPPNFNLVVFINQKEKLIIIIASKNVKGMPRR